MLHTDRTAVLIGHIPWVGEYVKFLPGVGKGPKRLRAFSMRQLSIRKNEGSGKRDLFYYLVRSPEPCRSLLFS